MPRIKDILTKNELSNLINEGKTADEIKEIATLKYNNNQKQPLKTQNIPTPIKNEKFDDDSISSSIIRGFATTGGRVASAYNYFTEGTRFDLTSKEEDEKRAKILDHLDEIKENTSRKNISEERKKDLEELDKESANAKGFLENAYTGIKKGVDTLVHPKEWTMQGATEIISPENLIGFGTGSLASKIVGKPLIKTLVGASAGAVEGGITNSAIEYAVAKGNLKSDEEAKKIAIQSAGAGIGMGATFGGMGGAVSTKLSKKNSDLNKNIKISDIEEKIKNNKLLDDIVDDDIKNLVVEGRIKKELINDIKSIDEAEKISTQKHKEIKIKLQKAYEEGANLNELLAIKEDVPLAREEVYLSNVINEGTIPSKDVAGYKLVNIIEDTIKHSSESPDDIFIKLRQKNIKSNLAKVATQSYKEKNTDILVDYIANKTEEYLDVKYKNIKEETVKNIDISNKNIIADEKAWSTSLTKKSVDDFIEENIGNDFLSESQRGMIYELNKIGLVEDVKIDNIREKLNEKDANGAYDVSNKNIILDEKTLKLDRTQILTHEYIHSATTKLLENKQFNSDITNLMKNAKLELEKNQIRTKGLHAFTNADEFVAEAFSNPSFAKKLNNIKLDKNMQKKYGVTEQIKTVWDLVVDKFSNVIYELSGKKFKINRDSYFESLNNMLGKEINELEKIKSDRIFTGESFKNIQDRHPNNKILMAKELEDKYITDGKINIKVLENEALPYRNINYDYKQFKKDFGKSNKATIESPIGDVILNVRSQFYKLKTWKEDRTKLAGVIKETIKNPLFIVHHNNSNKYYSLYKDDVGFTHIVSVVENEKGIDILKSNYEPFNKKRIQELIEVPNEDLLYVRGTTPTHSRSYGTILSKKDEDSVASKNIITNKENKSQGDNKNAGIKDKTRIEKNMEHKGAGTDSTTTKLYKSNDDDGRDTKLNSDNVKLSKTDKQMEGQEASTNTKRGISQFDKDELVQLKDGESFKSIKEKSTQKFSEEKKVKEFSNYSKKVDNFVDNLYEKIIMKTLDFSSQPFKMLIDKMAGTNLTSENLIKAIYNPNKENLKKIFLETTDKSWLEIANIQKQTNEIINSFNINKTIIYEEATTLRKDLEYLSKEQNKNLLKVLNGDMKIIDLENDLKPLYKRFRKQIDKNASKLVDLGILKEDERIKDYVKRYYKQYLEDSEKIKNIPSKAFQKFYKRKDLDYETRVKLGMIEDAGLVISNTIAEQNILLQKAQVLKSLAEKFGKDEVKEGYVRISDETLNGVKKWGYLGGKYVPKELKKELDTARVVSSEIRILEDVIYKMVDHVKVNVTVKNPATHVYNIGSNLSLSFLAGDFMALGKTIKMMLKNPNEFKALVKKANSYGLNSYLDEWEPQIAFHENKSKKISIIKTIIKNLYMTKDSKSGNFVRKLYDWEDKIFKVARFKRLLDEGFEEKTAYKSAMETYVDYSTPVPSALKVLDKSGLMPFLHYQYKATPVVAKTILKNPFKALILGLGISSIGGLRWQDEDDKYYKSTWADNKAIGNQFFTKEWVKIGNSGYYWNLGRLVPGTKFDFDFGGFISGLLYIKDGRSPLGYEVVKNEDEYKHFKKMMMVTENYTPPITYGRYGQRFIKIALGKTGIINEPKNPVSKKNDTLEDTLLRGLGIRQFDELKELKKHYKKAVKTKDKEEIKKIKESMKNRGVSFNLNEKKKPNKMNFNAYFKF